MKIRITEKDHKEVLEDWKNQAKSIESVDEFINRLDEVYDHDYGTVVHACYAVMLAAFNKFNKKQGITGFQASCLGWMLAKEFFMLTEGAPARIVDYSRMLYPQNCQRFQKIISNDTWEYLQEQARLMLEENSFFLKETNLEEEIASAHPDVVAHWQSIVDGVVPFGYTVGDSE